MNFEAVPCMLRNGDSSGGAVYGLLIRQRPTAAAATTTNHSQSTAALISVQQQGTPADGPPPLPPPAKTFLSLPPTTTGLLLASAAPPSASGRTGEADNATRTLTQAQQPVSYFDASSSAAAAEEKQQQQSTGHSLASSSCPTATTTVQSSSSSSLMDFGSLLDDFGDKDLAKLLADSEYPFFDGTTVHQTAAAPQPQAFHLQQPQEQRQHFVQQNSSSYEQQQQQQQQACTSGAPVGGLSSAAQVLPARYSCKYARQSEADAVAKQWTSTAMQQMPPTPRLDWEAPAVAAGGKNSAANNANTNYASEHAATPDSGIQSIAGSPAGRFTTVLPSSPMVSPVGPSTYYQYQHQQYTNNNGACQTSLYQSSNGVNNTSTVLLPTAALQSVVPPTCLSEVSGNIGQQHQQQLQQFSPNSTTSSSRASISRPILTEDISDVEPNFPNSQATSAELRSRAANKCANVGATTNASVVQNRLERRRMSSSSSSRKSNSVSRVKRLKKRKRRRLTKKSSSDRRVAALSNQLNDDNDDDAMPKLTPEHEIVPIVAATSAAAAAESSECVAEPSAKPVQVDLKGKVDEMDVKFENVCTAVLRGTTNSSTPAAGEGQTGPTNSCDSETVALADKSTANVERKSVQQLSNILNLSDMNDPNVLAERILSTLKPEQLRQFSSIVESRLRKSANDEVPQESARCSQAETRTEAVPALTATTTKQISAARAAAKEKLKKATKTKRQKLFAAPTDVERVKIFAEKGHGLVDEISSSVGADRLTNSSAQFGYPTDNSEEQERAMVERLATFRRKSRQLVDPELISAISALNNRISSIRLRVKGQSLAEAGRPNNTAFPLKIAEIVERLAEQREKQEEAKRRKIAQEEEEEKRRLRPFRVKAGSKKGIVGGEVLEKEADSSESEQQEAVNEDACRRGFVEIKQSSNNCGISLKIKLSALKSGMANNDANKLTASDRRRLPLKKRPTTTTLPEEKTTEPELNRPEHRKKSRRRRKVSSYPWDRKKKGRIGKQEQPRSPSSADNESVRSPVKKVLIRRTIQSQCNSAEGRCHIVLPKSDNGDPLASPVEKLERQLAEVSDRSLTDDRSVKLESKRRPSSRQDIS